MPTDGHFAGDGMGPDGGVVVGDLERLAGWQGGGSGMVWTVKSWWVSVSAWSMLSPSRSVKLAPRF